MGIVEQISIGPSDDIRSVQTVLAHVGAGLVGDRHYLLPSAGQPARWFPLTIIAAEALEAVGITGHESRRQIVTSGVDLPALIGHTFSIGTVDCYGVKLCEPCKRLERKTRPGIIGDLLHIGGIYAEILSDGYISVGDRVRVLS